MLATRRSTSVESTRPADEVAAGATRRFRVSPLALLTLTAAVITATSVAAYFNGRSGIDLAIFDQGFWAASRSLRTPGSIIRETIFEDHFAPGMLVFVGLYRLIPSPVWLLVGQGVAAWAAVRLIVGRLRPALGDRRSSLVGVAILLSPPVAWALLWDVHFVVFAVPFALAAALAIEDGRPNRALVFGLLAATFRIDLGLATLAAFAAMPGPRQGRLRPAGVLLAYLAVAQYFEQALGHEIFWSMHYSHLGATPGEALTHPWRLVATVLSPRALVKALPWLASGAFLALARPRLALVPAAVVALPVLLSHWPGTDNFYFQYGYAPTLLLALAWIPVARRPDRAQRIIFASLGLALILGPVLPALVFPEPGQSYAASVWVPDRNVLCIVEDIPASAGVSASPSPLSLLSHRDAAYLWPFPFEAAPDDVLPGPQLRHGMTDLAETVDYLIVPREDRSKVGPEFTADGGNSQYLRFRRTATTSPASPACRP